jgi:hypothetical protein
LNKEDGFNKTIKKKMILSIFLRFKDLLREEIYKI